MLLDWPYLDEMLFHRERNSISGDHFRKFDAASIGAATRLLNWIQSSPNDRLLQNALQTLTQQSSLIHQGLEATKRPDNGAWAQEVGYFPVITRNGFASQTWTDFRQTVVRLLQQHQCGRSLALALSMALHEMADNIVQHSQSEGAQDFIGLVGVEIKNGSLGFGVSDAGRGALASLRENPANAHIHTENDAIIAAAREHRSRRPGSGEGTGFKELFKSLANLNGKVRFSSGNARVTFSGAGVQTVQCKNSHFERGFHLAASCQFRG